MRPPVSLGDLVGSDQPVLLIANRVLAALDATGSREAGNRFFQQALAAPDMDAFLDLVLAYVEDSDLAVPLLRRNG